MTLLYYQKLEPNRPEFLLERAYNGVQPFYQYLETAISSMKNKEVEAGWEKWESDVVELVPQDKIYRILSMTQVCLNQEQGWYRLISEEKLPADFEPNFQETLRIRALRQSSAITSDKVRMIGHEIFAQLPFTKPDLGKISWGYDEFSAVAAWWDANCLVVAASQQGDDLKIYRQEHGSLWIKGSFRQDFPIEIKGGDGLERHVFFDVVTSSSLPKDIQLTRLDRGTDEPVVIDTPALAMLRNQEMVECEEEDIDSYIQPKKLFFLEGGKPFEYLSKEGRLLFCVDNGEDCLEKWVVSSEGIRFKLLAYESVQKQEKGYWIQLVGLDEEGDDEILTRSNLEYFFDDGIEVEDSQCRRYEIKERDNEDKRLILQEKGTGRPCFPADGRLKVRVNTYQWRMQREAILTLQNMPVGKQRDLLKLFEKRDCIDWPVFTPDRITNWLVLTNPQISGTMEQRDFVEKALATPDFAILEGPPGSGKTTAILELICQIIERGQHVLLCGSTHVAIDNVLERLKELGLLGRILPVRIGDEARISEDIQEFRIGKMVDKHQISERLLLEAANLVCGTTIGILQHPLFKQREKARYEPLEPIVPEFDYLILDECSKTTFQEFLVPALYARRWILVGDIHQLSPYTEQEHIVSNLDDLKLGNSVLSKSLQMACLFIQKLYADSNRDNKYLIACDNAVLPYLLAELEQRKEIQQHTFLIGDGLHEPESENIRVFSPQNLRKKVIELAGADIIFMDRQLVERYLHLLPANFIILGHPQWEETIHAYRHYHRYGDYYRLKDGRRNLQDSMEIAGALNDFFEKRSWSKEMAWRIVREYELRLVKREHNWLKRDREILMPKTQTEVAGRVETIGNIALPSILEGIQSGIKKRGKLSTTLSSGLKETERNCRHTVLSYQHRMHPQISDLPRALFYENNALKDAEFPQNMEEKRAWNYTRYAKRRIWLDVDGKTEKNHNNKEAWVLEHELGEFVSWAVRNPNPLCGNNGKWTVACLTFYKGQERKLRENLRKFCHQPKKMSRFSKDNVDIFLYTVDKFQGHEADLVFLSMVQTRRTGFMDSPNRLNVAITRAKYQLVIIGNHSNFAEQKNSEELKQLANQTVEKKD